MADDPLTKEMLETARVIARGRGIREVERLIEAYGGELRGGPSVPPCHSERRATDTNTIGTSITASVVSRLGGSISIEQNRMRVRCTTNQEDDWKPDLTVGASYAVLGIEASDYRIIGDRGEPLLYPPS